MPEGDTVFRAARRLDRSLSGRVLVRSDLRVPAHATADLVGGTVLETVSRGKHLLTRLRHHEHDWTLHTHLKMEGSWQVYTPGQRWRRPAYQARVVLGVDGADAVGFSLGMVDLLPTSEEHTVVGHLGPDLLGPEWSETEAVHRLLADPARTLAEALLDQRNLAGLGTMYVAELCFLLGVHPTATVADVPDVLTLVRRGQQLLRANISRATQTTTGDLRDPHWVFRRERTGCRRCGTPVRVSTIGREPTSRVVYACPSCQRGATDR
ncbi:MAG: DNA-formamidopyrimidine glycosylase family protein [Nocardioides sp.]